MQLFSHLFKKEPSRENRIATIVVTAEALLGLLQLDGTKTLRMEGVPADAHVEAMWVNPDTRTLHIGIESEELCLVTEGALAPSICVTVYATEQVPQQALVGEK